MTKITWKDGVRHVDGRPEGLQNIYIVVWTDGTIESVWDDKALAQHALESHATESGCPLGYYHIVERKLNRLHFNE